MSDSQSPLWSPLFHDSFSDLELSNPRIQFRDLLGKLESNPELLGGKIVDRQMANCCVGALWLKADYFEQAHALFQDVQTSTGSLWHGFSHRREGDYGNASYWFARCPNHPAGKEIQIYQNENQTHSEKLATAWNYDDFNRLVKKTRNSPRIVEELMRLQETEWRQTFLWTLQKALGEIPVLN